MRMHAAIHHESGDKFTTRDVTDAGRDQGGPYAALCCNDQATFYAASTPAEVAALVQRKADALAALAAEIRQRHGIEPPAAALSAHDCTREGRM